MIIKNFGSPKHPGWISSAVCTALGLILAAPACWAAGSGLSVSSATAVPGGSVVLNLSFQPGYTGTDAGIQWNLNVPANDVASVSTSSGAAALAAGETVSCAGNKCVLSGDNATPLTAGVVAVVSLNLTPQASGNFAIQLTNSAEALLSGSAGTIFSTDGVVSVAGPITVTMTPQALSLAGSQTQQFVATVSGASTPGVSWSLNPALGTISSGGLYTAPASASTVRTVTVTATSTADPSKFATANVTLTAALPLAVSPSSATLFQSQSLRLSASQPVTWSIYPLVGSISTVGVYTAPASVSLTTAVTITATSVENRAQSVSASVTIIPVAVVVNPGSVIMAPSTTRSFTASVSGTTNPTVTWKMKPTMGTLSPQGVYTAPAYSYVNQIVTLTATSVADPTKWSIAKVKLSGGRK